MRPPRIRSRSDSDDWLMGNTETVPDFPAPTEIAALLNNVAFREFSQYGFSETELHSLALLDVATKGASSADLFELLPKIATKENPHLGAEFMREPNDELDGYTPLDYLASTENFYPVRRAIATAIEAGW